MRDGDLLDTANLKKASTEADAHYAYAYLWTSRQAAVCCQLSTFQSANEGEPGVLVLAMTE